MKFLKFIPVLILLILIGVFAYLGLADLPVKQEQTRIDIPNDQLFQG